MLLSFLQAFLWLGLFMSRGMEVGLGSVVYPASEGSRAGASCSLHVRCSRQARLSTGFSVLIG